MGQKIPPSAGTQNFAMTPEDDVSVPELCERRPAALQEPRPQEGIRRHTGFGHELVLNPCCRRWEVPEVRAAAFIRAVDGDDEDMRQLAEASRTSRARRKRKRRKKAPKYSSSTLLPRGRAGDQGIMHEYADGGTEDVIEYVQRADGPKNIHTVVAYTPPAEPLISAHSKEAAPGMKEVHKFFEKKMITGDTGEEIILKNGLPVVNVYSDRTHLYIIPSGNYWLDWGKNRHRYVWCLECSRRWTGWLLTSTYGQVWFKERVEQTLPGTLFDKTVKDLICLLYYDHSTDL